MARWKLIAGIIIALIAFPFFVGGLALTVVLTVAEDNEGYYMSPWSPISDENAVGFVFNVDIETGGAGSRFDLSDWADFKLRTRSNNGKQLFVGLAESDKVEAYLTNLNYHILTNLDFGWDEDHTYNKQFHPATGSAGDEPVWDVSNTGTAFTTYWAPKEGNWTVVVLNADYSENYDIQYKVGVKAPILRGIGIGLLVFGIILFIIAGLLIYFDIKQHRVKPTPVWATKEFAREAPPPKAPPGKIFCTNCGTQAEEGDVFCTICGDRLDLAETRFRTEVPYEEPHPDSDQLIVANFGTRFWAWVIDFIVAIALLEGIRWAVYAATGSQTIFLSGFDPVEELFFSFGPLSILLFAYFFICEWQWGETLGKRALGLQVVDQNTGEPLKDEPIKVALSAIGKAFLLPLDMIIGLILGSSWEKDTGIDLKQRLFSRIAGTTVIRKRKKSPELPIVKFAPDR